MGCALKMHIAFFGKLKNVLYIFKNLFHYYKKNSMNFNNKTDVNKKKRLNYAISNCIFPECWVNWEKKKRLIGISGG